VELPILSTDGSVMDSNEEHPLNVELPILVTIFPMVTFVKLVRTVEESVGIEFTLALYEKFGKFVFLVKTAAPVRVVP
jgi:hypothetical protein